MTQETNEQSLEDEDSREVPDNISPNVKAWSKKAVEASNRMSTDEEYRKEIAKRIR